MQFDLPKEQSSIIKVFGVGGGGSNAVNHMYRQGITGVDFIICNTDQQALDISPVPIRIQLGSTLTEGRGAGSIPDVGRNAAIEDIEAVKEILQKNTKMVFITAGMGGGTGTGAAPVIAQAAKEMGILTVGIVTMPFLFEGRKRKLQASEGIEQMRKSVDTLLVINNDKLREIYGNLNLRDAFAQADNILASAAKGIAEVISVTGLINVDFNDVNTVMKDSGVAIMGSAKANGEDRAIRAVEEAMSSPLLNDNHIAGANYVLLNITYGKSEILMDEIADITDYIQDEAGNTAEVIWGHGHDESLGDDICVTIIATGFNKNPDTGAIREVKKTVINLDEEVPVGLTQPVQPETEQPKNTLKPLEDEPKVEEPYLKTTDKPQQGYISFDTDAAKPVFSQDETSESNTSTWDFTTPSGINTGEKTTGQIQEDGTWEPYLKNSSEIPKKEEPAAKKDNVDHEAQQQRSADRISKLKELSMRLRTPSGIADIENEPAYKRRQVQLDDTPHSSESQVSRYTLGDDEGLDGESRSKLNDNNSFIHDNVD